MKKLTSILFSLFCAAAFSATPPYKPNVFTTNTLARATFVPATGEFSITNAVALRSNATVSGTFAAEAGSTLRGVTTISNATSARTFDLNASQVKISSTSTFTSTNQSGIFIGGGGNFIDGIACTLIGGLSNYVDAGGIVIGGAECTNAGDYSGVIAGGRKNKLGGDIGFIAGGENNFAGADMGIIQSRYSYGDDVLASVIVGGDTNKIDGAIDSVIVGGLRNVIGGGEGVITIGSRLTNSENYSVMIGYRYDHLLMRSNGVSYGGWPLWSGCVTNLNPLGPVTNYMYYTNGFLYYMTNNPAAL